MQGVKIDNSSFNRLVLSAFIAGAAFFSLCLYLMYNGHFHEDAYILYRYVDNMAAGKGIVYYPGGPHAEGATDFLWLVLLWGMSEVGIDVGISTALLNSLAVIVVTAIFLHEVRRVPKGSRWPLYALSFMWIINSYNVAAILGFSVMFFISVVVLLMFCYMRPALVLWIPVLSLVIGLIRPDGVVMGMVFAIMGFAPAKRTGVFGKYLTISAVVFAAGLTYFVWRVHYFGNLLPLPLYVKGHKSLFSSMDQQYRWLEKSMYIIIPAAIFIWKSAARRIYLRALLPVAALFVAFCLVTQSQNIGYRFQAPIFVGLYYVLIMSLADYVVVRAGLAKARPYVVVLLIILLAVNVYYAKKIYIRANDKNYVNDFAYKATQLIPSDEAILLTEAGRFAFWDTGGHVMVDLVGLNTAYPAKSIISAEYMEEFNPALVFFYHFHIDELKGLSTQRYKRLDEADRLRLLNAKMPFNDSDKPSLPKVYLASLVSQEFLVRNADKYDIFAVDPYGKGVYPNIYALRKDIGITDSFEAQLRDTLTNTQNQPSYLELRRMLKAESRAN